MPTSRAVLGSGTRAGSPETADWGSVAPIYPDVMRVNTQGVPENKADLVAYVDRIAFRRPTVGRIPIANIDAPAFIEAIEARRLDLLSD